MSPSSAKSSLIPSADSIFLRWKNFRGFSDTGSVNLKPITILLGANNSGKSSFLSPLLLMKETVDSNDAILALKTAGDTINVGSYSDIVHNHQVKSRISFNIAFHLHNRVKERDEPTRERAQPGRVVFEFVEDQSGHGVHLFRYEVFDTEDRRMLKRELKEDGHFSLNGLAETVKNVPAIDVDKKFDARVRKYIAREYPDSFLFTDEAFGRAIRERELLESPGALSPFVTAYLSIVETVRETILHILDSVHFIGPIRSHPKRLYFQTGALHSYVGADGANTPEFIFRWNLVTDEYTKKIEKWLKAFDFNVRVIPRSVTKDAFSIYLKEKLKGATEINLADAGFGISQLLPIVAQCVLACESPQIIMMEQPEIHLNPSLQVTLADLFVEVANSGSAVIVESHSEHLILRLRRLIALGKIESNNVGLYFVEKVGGESQIRQIPIDELGHIDGDEWPKDFFGSALEEAIGLAMAQNKRNQNHAK